jgi:type IV pilus assembly protein PilC
MPVFKYYAIDAKGRRVQDKIEAANWAEAFKRLNQLGLTVIDLRDTSGKLVEEQEEKTKLPDKTPVKKEEKKKKSILQAEIVFARVTSKDLSILSKQLGALIEAGVGLVDALEIIADSIDNPYLKKELPKIALEIKGGSTLSKALEKRKDKFDEFFINMIQVGEETGQLDIVLKRSADYYKRISEIINKIKSASFYPSFIFVAATIITLGILYFLVPTFAQIYHSLGGELPALTQMLINASNWLQENIIYLLGGTLTGIIVFVLLYKKVYLFRKAINFIQLKLPLFGALFVKGALAKFSRTFATLFSAGVSIERCMELSAKVTGNVIYQEAIQKAQREVIQGERIWKAFEKTKRFPLMFIAMLKIGEETGQLDSMLESLADFYEDEVKTTIDGLISMIEPLMMVIIGSIVGTILMALYLPIFKMGELIK